MVRFGNFKSIPDLKRLWKVCFGDDDAYIDDFFSALYKDENVLCFEEDGALMGASHFLPGEIYSNGNWIKIRYVYALAVYPEYRGRGIAGKLLSRAFAAYQAPLIAEPANEGLIQGFYEPHGFLRGFYLDYDKIELPHYGVRAAQLADSSGMRVLPESGTLLADSGMRVLPESGMLLADSETQITAISVDDYLRIRDTHFQKQGYVRWPRPHVLFALREHCSNGGAALLLKRAGGREDLLLYAVDGMQVVVTETTLPSAQVEDFFLQIFTGGGLGLRGAWPAACQDISRSLPGECEFLLVKSPAGQTQPHRGAAPGHFRFSHLTGMAYGMEPVGGYLNLTLD